ncbi:hypothetical protein CEQ90_02690 [Lewinellaceae bacterium SD302]|nr:hypothetical protein CEQ90_02690 [Lewinellaceae bacterium SD302]
MKSHRNSLVYKAGRYVTRLLLDELPKHCTFHGVQHTFNVVKGVRVIGKAEGLAKKDIQLLMIAAWFHDTGHIDTYNDHEKFSASIAREFLMERNCPKQKIDIIEACIQATKMPQNPRTLMEKVICDADLYHLSFPTYENYQQLLREEWKVVLGKDYSNEEWNQLNDSFLQNHSYFTHYGKTILEPKKWIGPAEFEAKK